MPAAAAELEARPINVRRLVADYGTTIVLLGGVAAAVGEMRSIRIMAENNAEKVDELPTAEAMKVAILEAMRPMDVNVAELKAEVRHLSERVLRLETGSSQK